MIHSRRATLQNVVTKTGSIDSMKLLFLLHYNPRIISPKQPIWIELIGVLRCKISHSLQCTTGYGKLDQLLPRCLTPKDIQRPVLPSFCCCLQISGPRRHGHSLSFFMSEFVTLLTPHQLHALTQLPLIYSDLNFSPCGRPTPSAI